MHHHHADTTYVHLNRLIFPDPVVAGMNPLVLFSLAYKYRATNEDAEPIRVTTSELYGYYEIEDGRHRAVASMIAGRKTVLAEIA